MTVKPGALWGAPKDAAAFDTEYGATHLSLAAAVPGLQDVVASKALDGPYCRMAELIFESGDDLQEALGSAQGQALLSDAGRLWQSHGSKLDVLTVDEQIRL